MLKAFGKNRTKTSKGGIASFPHLVTRIDGYCRGIVPIVNTPVFLQLFDSVDEPFIEAIPVKSLQILTNDGFSFVFSRRDAIKLSCSFFGLSTDETFYNPDSSGNLVSGDMTIHRTK